MKRKVAGLTMNVEKVYDNKHHFLYTKYTLMNDTVSLVVNYIISELASKYCMVENKTEEVNVNTDYGTIEACKGSIICRDKEQMEEYFNSITL